MTTRLVKVVFTGDGGVGKTSLIRQYTEGKFETSRIMTIGVDFHTHTVDLPDGKVKLSIWDMAGQERFQPMRPGFYPGSRVAAMVYDVTDPETFDHLGAWLEEIRKVVPGAKLIVVGNKIDLPRVQDRETAQKYAERLGVPHLETSARTGQGLDALFKTLAVLAVA